jgi:hypothetical protein
MADSFAQTVKQQTDIVRVVGAYVKLRKSSARSTRKSRALSISIRLQPAITVSAAMSMAMSSPS